jgi:hypothetical protein
MRREWIVPCAGAYHDPLAWKHLVASAAFRSTAVSNRQLLDGLLALKLLVLILHFIFDKLGDDVETFKILRDYVFVLDLYAKSSLQE